jgi:hypothetical protein
MMLEKDTVVKGITRLTPYCSIVQIMDNRQNEGLIHHSSCTFLNFIGSWLLCRVTLVPVLRL